MDTNQAAEILTPQELASRWTKAAMHSMYRFSNGISITPSETQTINGPEADDDENEKPRFDFVLRGVDAETVLDLIHEITETDFDVFLKNNQDFSW